MDTSEIYHKKRYLKYANKFKKLMGGAMCSATSSGTTIYHVVSQGTQAIAAIAAKKGIPARVSQKIILTNTDANVVYNQYTFSEFFDGDGLIQFLNKMSEPTCSENILLFIDSRIPLTSSDLSRYIITYEPSKKEMMAVKNEEDVNAVRSIIKDYIIIFNSTVRQKITEMLSTDSSTLLKLNNITILNYTNDFLVTVDNFETAVIKGKRKLYSDSMKLNISKMSVFMSVFAKCYNIFGFNSRLVLYNRDLREQTNGKTKSIKLRNPEEKQTTTSMSYSFKNNTYIASPQQLQINLLNKKTTVSNRIKPTSENIWCYLMDLSVAQLSDSEKSKLINAWWYKYYFGVPICAFGRFTQSTGTCWCNAVLNLLFLTKGIAELLKDKYKFLSDGDKILIRTEFDSFEKFNTDNSSKTLRILLFAMINLTLNSGLKASPSDKNFILQIAARLKSLTENSDENYWMRTSEKLLYGDGSFDNIAFGYCLSVLFDRSDYYLIGHNFINHDTSIFSNRANINGSNLYPEEIIQLFQSEEQVNIILNPEHQPKIILITGSDDNSSFDKVPKKIKVNNRDYILVASTIGLEIVNNARDGFHAIVGLTCDDTYYIYDSNGPIEYDKWDEGSFINYSKKAGKFYGTTISNIRVKSVVYINASP